VAAERLELYLKPPVAVILLAKGAPKSRREEKSSAAPKKESTPTLRFLGNYRDLVLPFWVAVVAFAVIGGIG